MPNQKRKNEKSIKVLISNEAKQNVIDIYEYIAKDSIKYAIKTTKDIKKLIHDLEKSPYLGRYVPELQNKHYREIIYKSYRIIYSIAEKEKIIYIHFVIHGKRNLESFYKSYISKNNF